MQSRRLREARTLQKARPDADPVFAADAGLAVRALAAVEERRRQIGTPADAKAEADAGDWEEANNWPEDVTPSAALKEISAAIRTLEAGHALLEARRLAETLRERERWDARSPAGRLDHPRQFEAYMTQFEFAIDRLRRANALGERREREQFLRAVQHGPAAQRARPLIVDRRWKQDTPVAADAELAELATGLRTAEAELQPTLIEARAVLARYAPTIRNWPARPRPRPGNEKPPRPLPRSSRNRTRKPPGR